MSSRSWLLVAALMAAALTATPLAASAQPGDADDRPVKIKDEGDYGGVTPGEAGKPAEGQKPRARAKVRVRKGTLSWIGFQPTASGSRVFLQAAAPFEFDQHVEGSTLVVHAALRNRAKTVRRPLDTRFFETPVRRVSARQVSARRARKGQPARKAGIEVRIEFKTPADAREAQTSTATEADGLFYLYLDFGPGTASTEPARPTIAPPAADAASDLDK